MIQLREKDLSTWELETLAKQALEVILEHSKPDRVETPKSRLFINSRADVAIAVGAGGVHLRSPENDIAASEARAVLNKAGLHSALIGVSCHSASEVRSAEAHGADFALFGPVYEKEGVRSREGLRELRHACVSVSAAKGGVSSGSMPVLAIGGVTLGNASECVAAGAAGVAGIRLFQDNDILYVVENLRGTGTAKGYNPSDK